MNKNLSDRELRGWLSQYKATDLFEMSKMAKEKGLLHPNDRKFIYDMAKQIHKWDLTGRQMRKLKNLVDWLSTGGEEPEPAQEEIHSVSRTHLTIRMAWHDSGWNGCICKQPYENIYCVGQHSLLSRRLRERRETDLEQSLAGTTIDIVALGGYIPPCFWSVNAQGEQSYTIEHDNPAASSFPKIEEQLPAASVFTWPFLLSFVRDQQQAERYGRYYPEKLFNSRVARFRDGIHNHESIAFLYANYDNPVSGDIHQYLLLGCAYVTDQGKPKYFNASEADLEKVRARRGSQNFPRMNWALRYSLDFPNGGFFLPYHAYLQVGLEIDPQYQDLLEQVRVVISEPELVSSFKYVSKPIGDDTAIFLLTKLRKSLVTMIEQGVAEQVGLQHALAICDDMQRDCWEHRTHFPGFARLARAFLGRKSFEIPDLDSLVTELRVEHEHAYGEVLAGILENPADEKSPIRDTVEPELRELRTRIKSLGLCAEDIVRLSMLNLTQHQFTRLVVSDTNLQLVDVARNPYLLAEEYEPGAETEDANLGYLIDGLIGIHTIDIAFHPQERFLSLISRFQNISPSDPRRVRALILEHLKALEGRGHCYEEAESIQRALIQHPLLFQSEASYTIGESLRQPSEGLSSHLQKKLRWINDGEYRFYYLAEIWDAEKRLKDIVNNYVGLADHDFQYEELDSYINDSIKGVQNTCLVSINSEEFKKERQRLHDIVLKRRLSIVTGGPGTGKSYEILHIIRLLLEKGERFLLLTPTGKAAQRLSLDTSFGKLHAQTIDKFLYNCRDQATSIVKDLTVVIDECSMIDLQKLDELLRKLDAEHARPNRMILVGDRYQLPPIGFGKPFFDIVDYLYDKNLADKHIATLTVNCRYQDGGAISEAVSLFGSERKHFEPVLQNLISGVSSPKLSVSHWEDQNELYDAIESKILSVFGIERDALRADPNHELNSIFGVTSADGSIGPTFNVDAFQIVSPYRTTYNGTIGINLHFQTTYRKRSEIVGRSSDLSFRVGDKLVVTQNLYRNYQLKLANGTIGMLGPKRKFVVTLEDEYPFSDLSSDNIELAYALTVHKAQGSGFDHVFVIVPDRKILLSRELLYTAMSRAKKSLHLFIKRQPNVSSEDHILNIIRKTSHVLRRHTSVFSNPKWRYTYIPSDGIVVKSRVEYIIYKKLEEMKKRRGDFDFEYEAPYETGQDFTLHPDFRITLHDGTTFYWEHLGRTNDPNYTRDWFQRKKIYSERGDLERIITTDEEKGIHDDKVEEVISLLLSKDLGKESGVDSYSRHHYSLA